jgi:hypothetical protein
MSWQDCFRLKTAEELLNSSANIGHIGYHRFYRLPSAIYRLASLSIVGIGVRPDILPVTHAKITIGYPRTSATEKKVRIESYRHRL